MRCTAILATGAVVVLLVGVTGTTTAAWRDDALAAPAVVTSGAFDVELAPQGEVAPVVVAPGTRATTDYRLVTGLEGDNLDARLRLGVPAWSGASLPDALDVTVELRRDGAVVATGVLDAQGRLAFDGSPDVPVELAAGATTLDVTLVVEWPFEASTDGTTNGTASSRDTRPVLPEDSLVADLWQVRAGDEALDDARLWRATQAAVAPSVSVATPVAPAEAVPTAPADPQSGPDATTTETPVAATPADEVPDDEAPTDASPAGDAPAGGPRTGVGQAPAAPGTTGETAEDAAAATEEPPWAAELLAMVEDVGLDPAALDPAALDIDALPAPVTAWATEHDVATDDLLAWLREVAS